MTAKLGSIDRHEVEEALAAIGAAARASRCHVLVGSPTFAGSRRFNSLDQNR